MNEEEIPIMKSFPVYAKYRPRKIRNIPHNRTIIFKQLLFISFLPEEMAKATVPYQIISEDMWPV